mgnify:CR=1 FL=1
MTRDLAALTDQMLTYAKQAGADSADALAVDGTSVSIDVRGGALEQAERSEGIDIGLRVMIGHRQANVSSSDTRPETFVEMAQRAVAMAREAPEDPNIGLAAPDALARDLDAAALELADPTVEPDPATLQDDALSAEAAAMAVKGVTQVQSSTATYATRQIHMAATNGFSGGHQRTDRAISCVAIAGSGAEMERDYDGDSRIFQTDLRDAGDIGAGIAATALYEITPVGSPAQLSDELRYQSTTTDNTSDELGFLRLRYKSPGARASQLIETAITRDLPDQADTGFAMAIAGFGQLLRGGVRVRNVSIEWPCVFPCSSTLFF